MDKEIENLVFKLLDTDFGRSFETLNKLAEFVYAFPNLATWQLEKFKGREKLIQNNLL